MRFGSKQQLINNIEKEHAAFLEIGASLCVSLKEPAIKRLLEFIENRRYVAIGGR